MRMREHPRTCARMCVNSRPTPRQGMRFPIHALKRVACLVRRRSLLRRSTMRRRRCLCIRCWARLPLYAHTNKYTDSHTHTHTGTLSCETHSHSRTHTWHNMCTVLVFALSCSHVPRCRLPIARGRYLSTHGVCVCIGVAVSETPAHVDSTGTRRASRIKCNSIVQALTEYTELCVVAELGGGPWTDAHV